MGDLIQPIKKTAGQVTYRVDARKVFDSAMKKVDEALEILREPAERSVKALEDDPKAANLSVIVNGFVKTTEIRARLAAEQTKALIEMQKDINRCAIERERIAASSVGSDLSSLTEDQLSAMLEGSE